MLAQAIKRRLGKEENQKGFTLIELLAVIVILGIIAVIAVPLIGNIIGNTRTNGDIATGRQIYDAARLYVIAEKSGNFKSETVDLSELTPKYLETGIRLPSSKAKITAIAVTFNPDGVLQSVSITPKPEGSTANASPSTGGTYTADQILSAEATPSP